MPVPPPRGLGFSLIEILVAILVVGLLASAALPRFDRFLAQIRRRAALDTVVSELYRARMLAIDVGGGVRLVLRSDESGCIDAVALLLDDAAGNARSSLAPVGGRSHCLRHSADSIMHFNSRGMLRPPSRSIYSADAANADSVVVSVAGRVRRSY